jgi:NADPH-dependent 2,4-dienoyl-CoA reductase/sulfur reductase-like enzyme
MTDPAFQFEVVIIGAGPAGMAAACAAASSGKKVALIDNTPWLGGQIWRGEQGHPTMPQAQKWIESVRRSGVTVLENTSVIAKLEEHKLLAEHPNGPREICWQKLIVATGARELFLPFPGWTLPGVFGPGGLLALVKNGWPIAGKNVVLAGSGPLLLAVADGLKKRGASIVSMGEQAPRERLLRFGLRLLRHPAKIIQGLGIKKRLLGVPFRYGVWPVKAHGGERVHRVELTDGQRSWTEECDVLACAFHLVANLELPMLLGCKVSQGFVMVDEWQATTAASVYCAGEPTGIGGADSALVEGRIAGYAATGQLDQARALFAERRSWRRFQAALAEAFELRPEVKKLASNETIFCRCEDVSFERVRNFSGWREAKLLTRCGMGACQGRTCGAASQFILGWGIESVRPPVMPARISSLLIKN